MIARGLADGGLIGFDLQESGLPFPFFTKEAGTEGWGCSQREEQAHRKRGTKTERPAKNTGRASR